MTLVALALARDRPFWLRSPARRARAGVEGQIQPCDRADRLRRGSLAVAVRTVERALTGGSR